MIANEFQCAGFYITMRDVKTRVDLASVGRMTADEVLCVVCVSEIR